MFKSLVAEKIDKISSELELYTDGSFQNGLSSYAVVKRQNISNLAVEMSIPLPAFTAIFSAELAAIKAAIFYAVQMHTDIDIY